MSESKGTTTADRGEKNRIPRNRYEGNCFICGRESHRGEECRIAIKKSEKSGHADADKEGGGRGRCYLCGNEEHFVHKHCGL